MSSKDIVDVCVKSIWIDADGVEAELQFSNLLDTGGNKAVDSWNVKAIAPLGVSDLQDFEFIAPKAVGHVGGGSEKCFLPLT